MSTPPPPPPADGDVPPDSGYGSSEAGGYDSGRYGTGAGGQGYQAAPDYYGGGPTRDRDNNFGVIALVTGIIALIVCQPVGIVAIVYGRKAQAAQAAGTADNGTVGTVGFWLGVAALAVALLLIILTVVLVAVGALSLSFFANSVSST